VADALLLTPREVAPGAPSINNQNITVTDEEYLRLPAAMRVFYEKVRENLGLACVTAHLRHAGFSVRMVNLHGRTPSDEAVIDMMRKERPALIGLSIMYDLHIVDAVRLARCARIAAPDAVIAVGGAFCTYNAKLITDSVADIDCVAFGEAEATVVEMMRALAAGRDWRTVPGLWYRDGKRTRTSGVPILPDLTQSIWPARDLLRTHQAAGIPTRVASTYTSRGCHAKCTFCYAPRAPGGNEGPWRLRPAVDTVDEIEALQREFGTRFVWFNDDNFGGAFEDGFAHAVEFAEEIIRRGLKFSFHAEFRVDSGLIDAEALDLLHRAGLKSALLGLESGSARVLKRFRKGTTVAYNFDAARIFRAKGLELDPGWIMVEPGTSVEDLWQNLQFIIASKIHYSNHTDNPFLLFNRAVALRGSEMFDMISQPAPAPSSAADAAERVLAAARSDYRVEDDAVEALWAVWSDIGALVSERRENALPFLAQDLSDAVRHARATGASTQERNELTALLKRLRRWRNDLPHLFAAVVNFGLLAADGCTAGIDDLARGTREIVDAYDREHLGEQFDDFAEFVGRYRVGAPATLASS
jgi:radical SAM superfamily enzyme YgiQ (UPF0313 family)